MPRSIHVLPSGGSGTSPFSTSTLGTSAMDSPTIVSIRVTRHAPTTPPTKVNNRVFIVDLQFSLSALRSVVPPATLPQCPKLEQLGSMIVTGHVEGHALLANAPEIKLSEQDVRLLIDGWHHIGPVRP